ncbi:MAG TPA: PAS domain S-box protein, partial [Rudaea sp.]
MNVPAAAAPVRRSLLPAWLPVAIALIILAGGVVVWRMLVPLEEDSIRLQVDKAAVAARGAIVGRVRSQASAIQRQAERLDRVSSMADFDADAAQYLRDFPGVLGIERRIGDTIAAATARAPLTAAAIFAHEPSPEGPWETTPAGYRRTLSAPVRLDDGRLVYYLFHARTDGNSVLIAALDASTWLGETAQPQPNFDVALRDGDTVVMHRSASAPTDESHAQQQKAQALGRTWTIAVAPTVALVEASTSEMPDVVLGGSALLALITGALVRLALISRVRRDIAAHLAQARDRARRELGSILESITDAFVIVDSGWRYVYVNQHSARSIGRAPQEVIGLSLWDVQPMFRDAAQEQLVRAMRERVDVTFEHRAPDERTYRTRVYPHLDGLALSSHDITDQHRIAERLRRSEALLTQAQSLALTGSFLRNAGETVEHWSEQLRRTLGEDGDGDAHDHAPFLSYIHPDDRERVRSLEAELALEAGETEIKTRIVTLRGEERTVRLRLRLVNEDDGSATLVGTVQDISSQERTDAALGAALLHSRRQSAKFRALNRAMLLISAKLGHAELQQVLVEELREAVGAHVATLNLIGADGARAEPLLSGSGRYEDAAVARETVEALAAFVDPARGDKVLRLTAVGVTLHAAWARFATGHTGAAPLAGLLSVPLHDRGGRLIGFLQASDSLDGEFNTDDEAIAVQFAQIAAMALGWGRLIEDLRAAETRLSVQLEQVHRSRSLLAEAEAVARLGSWETDGTGVGAQIQLSDEAARILGVDSHTVSFDALTTLVHAEDAAAMKALFLAVLNGAAPDLDTEFRLVPDDSTRWVHAKAHALHDETPRRIVGTLQDVTEQRINAIQDRLNAQTFAGIAAGIRLEDSLTDVINLYENRFPQGICSILLVGPGQRLRTAAAPRLPVEYSQAIDGVQAGPEVGSCGTAVWRGRRVIVRDTFTDPLWREWVPIVEKYGLRACWSTPILDRAGTVLGTFAVYYAEPREPSAEELDCVDRAA